MFSACLPQEKSASEGASGGRGAYFKAPDGPGREVEPDEPMDLGLAELEKQSGKA